jgi:hypothetical protein
MSRETMGLVAAGYVVLIAGLYWGCEWFVRYVKRGRRGR